MESQTNIKKLFHEEGIRFTISAYQRAYSWEWDKDKEQVKQFIIDKKEQNPCAEHSVFRYVQNKSKALALYTMNYTIKKMRQIDFCKAGALLPTQRSDGRYAERGIYI